MIGRTISRRVMNAGAALAFALLCGCEQKHEPEFVTTVPWSFSDRFMVVDTHTHTTFSDGVLSAAEMLALARDEHCDAVAITDHTDVAQVGSSAYFERIDALREQFPQLIVIAGIEWNVPPYAGREHVTVLADIGIEHELAALHGQFGHDEQSAEPMLVRLQNLRSEPHDVVAFYNHPSRKDERIEENLDDYLTWHRAGDLVVGFEGAPGHQRAKNIGSYNGGIHTHDGWDPVVAEIGGVWDQLLGGGLNVWGALAVSDFHNQKLDFPPCSFSRIHVQVAERSHAGVLAGLRAGSFWADHGKILDALQLQVSAPGLLVPAAPGESFALGTADAVTVSVTVTPSSVARDENLTIELIGNGRTGSTEILESRKVSSSGTSFEAQFSNLVAGTDASSVYFRVRVRAARDAGRDLLAYSNPVRVYLQ
jgi:hypothetical protein